MTEPKLLVARTAGSSALSRAREREHGTRNLRTRRRCPASKNVVLVMSGKGGVGKSTRDEPRARALAHGHRVGLPRRRHLRPSIPTMLGVSGRPVSLDGKSIEPLTRFGLKMMSIGFLLEDPKQAIVWRGPMLHGALNQFLNDVNWGELDYSSRFAARHRRRRAHALAARESSGAVIVTTPQPVATDDVFKSVTMCQKVNIRVLGVVENMSYFIDTAGVQVTKFSAKAAGKRSRISRARRSSDKSRSIRACANGATREPRRASRTRRRRRKKFRRDRRSARRTHRRDGIDGSSRRSANDRSQRRKRAKKIAGCEVRKKR